MAKTFFTVMDNSNQHSQVRLIRWLLLLGTLFLYYPVTRHPFITYDDYVYVAANPHVEAGLTWSGLGWAFTTGYGGNWHPLTWISHMFDCEIFGLNAGGHHLTNFFFHLANALLLFELWRRLTGATWRSGLLAMLFAWHPLHVESVAWVAERKDVLSSFFFLLTMLAYTRHVAQLKMVQPGAALTASVQTENNSTSKKSTQSKRHYWAALVLFALGLMSKPMIVTLPFVLLLLDFWPLQRLSSFRSVAGIPPATRSTFAGLFVEKIPFFILSAIFCVVTFLVQKNGGNLQPTANLTWIDRCCAAILGYGAYLKSTFWPINLSVFYAYPAVLPKWEVLMVGLLLVFISLAVVMAARSRPELFVGWFWFLGMLVPVIGLVSVGSQSHADRYTYMPLIGIFIALIWGIGGRKVQWPPKIAMPILAGVVLLACAAFTYRQLGYWKDSTTLFEHARSVTADNPVIEDNLGLALDDLGKPDEARKHYELSLQLASDCALTWQFLGDNLESQKQYSLAIQCYTNVLFLGYDTGTLRCNYGNALTGESNLNAAVDQYQMSLRLDPDFLPAHYNMGEVLLRLGRDEEAAGQFAQILKLNPLNDLAATRYAAALARQGNFFDAVIAYRRALDLNPDATNALQGLAWILATSPDPRMRNGKQAVALALRAAELTQHRQPLILTALDAARAENGEFIAAIGAAQETATVAKNLGQKTLADQALARMELYQSGKAYHTPGP